MLTPLSVGVSNLSVSVGVSRPNLGELLSMKEIAVLTLVSACLRSILTVLRYNFCANLEKKGCCALVSHWSAE